MDWVKATIRDSLILLVFLVIGYGVLQLVDSSISPGEMTFCRYRSPVPRAAQPAVAGPEPVRRHRQYDRDGSDRRSSAGAVPVPAADPPSTPMDGLTGHRDQRTYGRGRGSLPRLFVISSRVLRTRWPAPGIFTPI